MSEQTKQLARVRRSIGQIVLDWCGDRIGREFHLEELEDHVRHVDSIRRAPGSAGRIFRHLESVGKVEYTLLNRRQSLYRIDAVNREEVAL